MRFVPVGVACVSLPDLGASISRILASALVSQALLAVRLGLDHDLRGI